MTDEPAVGERVVVRRVIGAPPERVFRNWTEPEQLRRWWGPGGFTCPDAQVDLRIGGRYRLVMQAPGGGPLMSVAGTYRTVDPPALLVYTWRWDTGPAASDHESLVTVEFTDLGDGRTEVVVTHERFPAGHDASPYRSGWDEGLEKLDAVITEERSMPEQSNTITIARPVGDVFAFLADAENDTQWRGGVIEMTRTGGQDVGATYRQIVAGPGGRRIDADVEITEFVPDQRIALRATKGPVRPTGSYDLQTRDGGTVVTFRLAATLGGVKKLMAPMVTKTMRSEIAAEAGAREPFVGSCCPLTRASSTS